MGRCSSWIRAVRERSDQIVPLTQNRLNSNRPGSSWGSAEYKQPTGAVIVRCQKARYALVPLIFLAVYASGGCKSRSRTDTTGERATVATSGVTLYALSRGKGVPDVTRKTYQAAREQLKRAQADGLLSRFEESRIGLEGETRLCVEFADAQEAEKLIQRLRAMVDGVDLLNLIEEPCEKPKTQR